MIVIAWRSNPDRLVFWYAITIGDDDFHPYLFREMGLGVLGFDLENAKKIVWKCQNFRGGGMCLGAIVFGTELAQQTL